jgi:hypothetical protein
MAHLAEHCIFKMIFSCIRYNCHKMAGQFCIACNKNFAVTWTAYSYTEGPVNAVEHIVMISANYGYCKPLHLIKTANFKFDYVASCLKFNGCKLLLLRHMCTSYTNAIFKLAWKHKPLTFLALIPKSLLELYQKTKHLTSLSNIYLIPHVSNNMIPSGEQISNKIVLWLIYSQYTVFSTNLFSWVETRAVVIMES